MSTATGALNIKMVAELLGDAPTVSALGGPKVFSLRAPQATPGDYITLGTSSESQLPRFGDPVGNTNSEMIHIWTRDPNGDLSKERALNHYANVERVLDARRLVLSGFTFVGYTRIVLISADPDEADMVHLIAIFEGMAI